MSIEHETMCSDHRQSGTSASRADQTVAPKASNEHSENRDRSHAQVPELPRPSSDSPVRRISSFDGKLLKKKLVRFIKHFKRR